MDATILISHDLFNSIAICLERRYLAQVFVPLVIVGLLVHAAVSLYKQKRFFQKKHHYPFRKRPFMETHILYVQIVSGLLLLILAAVHVTEMVVSGTDTINSVTSSIRFKPLLSRIYYQLFMLTTVIHTAAGLYRLYSKWVGSRRKIAGWCGAVFLLFYLSIGTASVCMFGMSADDSYRLYMMLKNETPADSAAVEAIAGRYGLTVHDQLLRRLGLRDKQDKQ